ncbi:hypothetical protein BC938DRAFT_474794 [Jimgerdemannia flammicorona]|uniref:F-box domain-containing protein n=1 Tax=Jimgerdemannia flammicorona TaxID=994334 RepID=A0A433QSB3_9FUNG|nr:hypothetical protein BC938DRAFT_474794 [Jimgerdemannia flammicorona]
MTEPTPLPFSPFATIPRELVIEIFLHLDILSLFSFLDTSRFHRRLLLSLPPIWRTVVFDSHVKMEMVDVYSTLRRFRDGNGLKKVVERVIMDGMDDPWSPNLIVLLVKFPNLYYLSATSRRRTTNLESDAWILNEMLSSGTIPAGSLSLRTLHVRHDYMDRDRLRPLVAVLEKLARERVQLDVRECGHVGCRQIVGVEKVECGGCGRVEGRCWKCVDACEGCKRRRFPPFIRNREVLELSKAVAVGEGKEGGEEEDAFSVFE